MKLARPYVTGTFVAYHGDTLVTRLSLAVRLTDDFTKGGHKGRVKVSLKGIKKEAFRNPSGYYLFTDLPAGVYTLRVEADLYFPEERAVDITALDPKNPVVGVVLKPRPEYPFPANVTLVRGALSDFITHEAIADADIAVPAMALQTRSDGGGDFVLYPAGPGGTIAVEIKSQGYTKAVNVAVTERQTTNLGLILFP